MATISSREVKSLLSSTNEVSLIDVRERGEFSKCSQLLACNVPLSRLEMLISELLPSLLTRIILVDSGGLKDKRARLAAKRLANLGYRYIDLMEGGIIGWSAAGYETFSGVNVLSKAFGEMVEIAYKTPYLTPMEVNKLHEQGHRMILLDARPFEEYHVMTIPGSINTPGAELVLRVSDLAPEPDILIIVNCAGRTRSIIGAQSLRNAQIPNSVAALKGGTMNWKLSGMELEYGACRKSGFPSPQAIKTAQLRTEKIREQFKLSCIETATVETWQMETEARTLYLFDVRLPEEFEQGHLPGSRNVPGGQLVQAPDEYMGIRNGRIVLIDDNGVRATMTASWLKQMGYLDVHILLGGLEDRKLEKGPQRSVCVGNVSNASVSIDEVFEGSTAGGEELIIDMGSSKNHRLGHIPGAVWVTRSRLSSLASIHPDPTQIILVSENGLVANLAYPEAVDLFPRAKVAVLSGGSNEWIKAGKPIEFGMSMAVCPEDDQWYKPYEDKNATFADMQEYLDWEIALVEKVKRDGDANFILPCRCKRPL